LFIADGGQAAARRGSVESENPVAVEIQPPLEIEHGSMRISRPRQAPDARDQVGLDPPQRRLIDEKDIRGSREDPAATSLGSEAHGVRSTGFDLGHGLLMQRGTHAGLRSGDGDRGDHDPTPHE